MNRVPRNAMVYVVDDDAAVRDSIRWLLVGHDFQVRTFGSAEAFLSHYDAERAGCLLVDVRMDGMSGLELQDHLVASGMELPLAFITGHGDLPMAVETMKKGAVDFIEKPFDEAQLIALVEHLLEQATAAQAAREENARRQALLAKLTSREYQVLQRIVAGRLNKQIAMDLGISIKTVEAHRSNVMSKLEADSMADMLKIAIANNLLHNH